MVRSEVWLQITVGVLRFDGDFEFQGTAKARGGGGGKHPFFSFHICYRASGAEQVGTKILQIRLSVPEI